MSDSSSTRYALLGCLLVVFSGFSTYMLHIKVGLNHNKHARVSQIVAADTAWAGKVLMDFAHEIDDGFTELSHEVGVELGLADDDGTGVNSDALSLEDAMSAVAGATATEAPGGAGAAAHHVTTNGPLRVAPGIVWVVPAFKRSWTLRLVLESLARAGAADSTVVVSQDADDAGVRDVATGFLKSGDLPKLRLVSHPWSCSRHPDSFPGNDPALNVGYRGDTYGNPRSEWATCLKHHWWWLLNYVWSSGADTVCLLEDDIIIMPGTLQWLAEHRDDVSRGFGVKLTADQIAVPWCMGRTVWERVHAAARDFCMHDDYNWDQTLAWLAAAPHSGGQRGGSSSGGAGGKATKAHPLGDIGTVSVPSTPLSKHVGTCEGWDAGGRDAKCTAKAIARIEQGAAAWMAKGASAGTAAAAGVRSVAWLRSHKKPNGGWGHPRDHEHCLEVSANVTRSMDQQYQLEVARELAQRSRSEAADAQRRVRDALHAEELEAQKSAVAERVMSRKEMRKHLLADAERKLHGGGGGGLNIVADDTAGAGTGAGAEESKDGAAAAAAAAAAASSSAVASGIAAASPLHSEDVGDRVLYTEEMFRELKYEDPDGGVWKQGWAYNYDQSFERNAGGEPLTIHVMPHSHNDPGWIKTYHSYYSQQTRSILSTMVAKLTADRRRTFIWAEISFFSLWWRDATADQQAQLRKLVAEGRWEFVTGGWVMNDEACVSARATYAQLEEGRLWLKETLGVVPTVSWQIDPFGHSAGQAQILKQLGYKATLIQRVHYALKKRLAKGKDLEFMWQTHDGPIFTQLMPYFSYDAPHTCGPDPSICCQFDFARMPRQKYSCPWRKSPKAVTSSNVAERAELWVDQVMKKAMLNRHRHVLVPLGDDFRYDSAGEADAQFENYQRMFDYLNDPDRQTKHNIIVKWSTLSQYFEGAMAHGTPNFPVVRGSFFPYSDRQLDYWTGYFNSRIFYKGMDRQLEGYLAAAEYACDAATADALHEERQALALFQHHDGITGTAKSFVVQDYFKTMQHAMDSLHHKIGVCMGVSPAGSGGGWGGLRGGGGKLAFNPTGFSRDGLGAWEVKVLPSAEPAGGGCVPAAVDAHAADVSPTPRVGVGRDGLIASIDGHRVVESVVWYNNKGGHDAGAYLMNVQGNSNPMRLVKGGEPLEACRDESAAVWRLTSRFDMVARTVVVPDDAAQPLLFEYAVDVRSRNNGELWASYRLEGLAEGQQQQLCADVHGLQYECHAPRYHAPVQAQFYPMPTMAWQEDARTRFSWVAAQPTGVANLKTGLTLMLDRCGNRDDARGLGQGVTDARAVTLRFEAMVETLRPGAHEAAFGPPYEGYPSLRALEARARTLNPVIELEGTLGDMAKVDAIRARLPAWDAQHTHWTNHHVTAEKTDERWH